MRRGSCVDCEERDALYISENGDELCSTCMMKTVKVIDDIRLYNSIKYGKLRDSKNNKKT